MIRWVHKVAICCAVLAAACSFAILPAWGVEVTGTDVAAPTTASPDTAVAGMLPGATRYGDAFCVRVAGSISQTTAQCAPAGTVQVTAKSDETDPGSAGVGLRPGGEEVLYAQAFDEAAKSDMPLAFWAGASADAASYVLYVPAGSADEGYGDFRLIEAEGSDGAGGTFADQLGRSDIMGLSFVEAGSLPAGSELYLRVSSMFGNGTYVNVHEPGSDGALHEMAAGVPVENGYIRFQPSGRGSFAIVNASDEEAASVVTDRFFTGAHTDNAMEVSEAPVGIVVGIVLAVSVVFLAIVLIVRSTKRRAASAAGSAAQRGPGRASRGARRDGKRGGLS